MGYLQYTKEEKKNLFNKVFTLKEKGKSHTEVCESLTKDGIEQRNGGKWEPYHITYILNTMRPRRRRASTKESQPTNVLVSRTVVEGIVTDPNLSDNQRVRMLGAYLSI